MICLVIAYRNYSDYNGHSFRKGGAQSLAEANVPSDTIQAMGRWTSDCYKLYISTPQHAITSAALALEPEIISLD
jgi:hypothetical protein